MFNIKGFITINLSTILINIFLFSNIYSNENDVYKQLNLFGEVYERVRR